MAIPIRRLLDDVGHDQARALLGVAPDAGPDECRRVALAQLDQADFDPIAGWHDAVEIVFPPRSEQQNATLRNSNLALHEAAEASLSDEIEAFAVVFFTFEPCERTRLWNSFRKRAKFSATLSWRLELLESGLNFIPPAIDSLGYDRQRQLIRWILTIFPLRPAARGATWILARDAMRDSPLEWEAAGNKLVQADPQLAQLVPDLVAAACSYKSQQQARLRQTKVRRREARKQKWARWRSGVSSSPIWMILLAIGLGARFIGTMSGVGSRSSSHRPAISADDIRNASEMLERMRIQQELHSRAGERIKQSDLDRESGITLETQEVKDGFQAIHLFKEIQRQRKLKLKSDSAGAEELHAPVTDPFETERRDPKPSEPDTPEPPDGSEP